MWRVIDRPVRRHDVLAMQFDLAHDQLLQQLLAELFDQNQLRQFVHDWVGGSITRQLPGDVVSHETLVHGVVVVLRRNGLLDHNLFRELLRVRPGQHALIADVAERCGAGGLEAPATSTALVAPSVRTPDYVVQQTYESMRRQRDILREFVNHFAPTRGRSAAQPADPAPTTSPGSPRRPRSAATTPLSGPRRLARLASRGDSPHDSRTRAPCACFTRGRQVRGISGPSSEDVRGL